MTATGTRIVVELQTRHAYFADGKCHSLAFEPSEATRAILSRQRFLFGHRECGFSVHATAETFFDMDLECRFWAVSQDPYFGTYTDLPRFGNDLPPLYTAAPGRSDNSWHTPSALAVSAPSGTRFAVDVRLSAHACVPPRSLVLELEPRPLLWRYFLLGEFAERPTEIVDLSAQDAIAFVESECVSPRRCRAFVSDRAIASRQIPPQRLQLRDPETGRVLVKRLPIPDFRKLGRERLPSGETMLVAEAYINP